MKNVLKFDKRGFISKYLIKFMFINKNNVKYKL